MLGYSVQAALLALAAASAIAQTAPYNTVTNTKRTVTNFNVETVRGIAFEAVAPFRVFAINTHGSTLNSYTSASTSAPATTFRTLNAPVALALWDDTEGVPFALVVGCGTHGIVKQNRNTGEIAGYLSLPSEPMDIVVDTDRNVAFVSCGGAFDRPATGLATPNGFEAGGVVVEIALGTLTEIRKNFIPSARPAFLNFEPGDPGESDNRIYVTPMLSGNQTTYLTDNVAADMRVVRTVSGMDDDDLFSIDTLGTVQSVVKKAGTILTAHGRNPFTNQYWILGVESFNAEQHTEPDHKGRFAENRLVITPLPGTPTTKSLDTVTAALAPMLLPLSSADKANKPVSFPFGLTFHAQTGFAVVTSSTGDMFRILDANGNAFRNVELPAGSIPRSVMLSPDQQSLYVYAWGTNKLHQYSVANLVNSSATDATPLRTLDLGVDPLPAAIRQGSRHLVRRRPLTRQVRQS
jgi:hypothetical protein